MKQKLICFCKMVIFLQNLEILCLLLLPMHCLPIVVFTAMLNFPLLPISPQDKTLSDDPIYLVYDMSFGGHYDAVQQQVNQLGQQHQDEQLIDDFNKPI